jgi:hypothetical protein
VLSRFDRLTANGGALAVRQAHRERGVLSRFDTLTANGERPAAGERWSLEEQERKGGRAGDARLER